MSLRSYLQDFHNAVDKINDYGFAESIDIRQEIRAAKQAVINATIVLVDGSVLYIKEFIDAKYDDHKHLEDETIIQSFPPDISDVNAGEKVYQKHRKFPLPIVGYGIVQRRLTFKKQKIRLWCSK
jgi:hypothetical protein